MLRENRSVLELLDADYTFVNERLARHYGIPNVRGSHFRRVDLPEGEAVRGGLLGQGSILTVTSYANRTSPVLRGKWVLENILGTPPPPPPADVPPLDESTAGQAQSMREAMEAHRANPGLCQLSPADGPTRAVPRELRRHRSLAYRGRPPGMPSTPRARCPTAAHSMDRRD